MKSDKPWIYAVGAYYRNDRPEGGLAVEITYDDDDDRGLRLADKCEKAMLAFDMRDPALAIAWLERVGRDKDKIQLTRSLGDMIVATIHWLERRGHLQSNDYNGVLWMGTQGETAFGIRHDAMPITDWREFKRRFPHVELRGLDSKDFEQALRSIFGTPPSS